MSPLRCLFTVIDTSQPGLEEIVRDVVAPVVRAVRARPELDSLFFGRFNKPWQIRFRILGEDAWVAGDVPRLLEERIAPLRERGVVQGHEFGMYDREVERYGGEEGMRFTEEIYHHDTLACVDLMEAEERGGLARSRREFSLVMTERLFDLMKLDTESRMSAYALGYKWAIDYETWQRAEFETLEQKYQSLRPGLTDLLWGASSRDPAATWGGSEPARIAQTCLDALRPVIDKLLLAHAGGRIRQNLPYLAWSWAHLHCNRLGLYAMPEAVLRFYMHRLYQDREAGAV